MVQPDVRVYVPPDTKIGHLEMYIATSLSECTEKN